MKMSGSAPKASWGAGWRSASLLCTRRDVAAHYTRPVWMCRVPLSALTVYGVLSSDAKGSLGPVVCGVYRERAGAPRPEFALPRAGVGRGVGKKGQAVSWGQMGWGEAPYVATGNETYGLTCSEFKGSVRGNCRCWFRGVWRLEEKEKQTAWQLISKRNCVASHPFPQEPSALWAPEGEGGGGGQRQEEETVKPIFRDNLIHPAFCMETVGGQIGRHLRRFQEMQQKERIFWSCSSSGCRNRRVSSEVEPDPRTIFSHDVEKSRLQDATSSEKLSPSVPEAQSGQGLTGLFTRKAVITWCPRGAPAQQRLPPTSR